MADPQWHPTYQPGDKYARVGTKDAQGVVTWGAPFLIAGENGQKGDYIDYWFKRSSSQPATPAPTDQDVQLLAAGWADVPPSGEGDLYMISAKRAEDGAIIVPWSVPSNLDGADALSGGLTNENHSVATDFQGNGGDFSNAGGTYQVFKGVTDITTGNGVAFAVQAETGVDVSINATTGVYTVNSMSGDSGTATFSATVNGNRIDKVYTITKNKAAPSVISQLYGPFLNQIQPTIVTNYAAGGGLLEFSVNLQMHQNGPTSIINQFNTFELLRDGVAVDSFTIRLDTFEPAASGTQDFDLTAFGIVVNDQPSAGSYTYAIRNQGPLTGQIDTVRVTIKQYPV